MQRTGGHFFGLTQPHRQRPQGPIVIVGLRLLGLDRYLALLGQDAFQGGELPPGGDVVVRLEGVDQPEQITGDDGQTAAGDLSGSAVVTGFVALLAVVAAPQLFGQAGVVERVLALQPAQEETAGLAEDGQTLQRSEVTAAVGGIQTLAAGVEIEQSKQPVGELLEEEAGLVVLTQ